jgi:hypothetical protein
MQLALVALTIFMYCKLTFRFISDASKKDQVRESLMSNNTSEASFSFLYERIKIKFHAFFLFMIAILILRTYLYVSLRFKTFDLLVDGDFATTLPPIPPNHIIYVGIGEFL